MKHQEISLGEQAYQRIKQDIVWCVLSPGEEVSEARLTQQYGLGKAPVRQALSRLSQEGFVQSSARKGHVIAPVTLQVVHDLFELRRLLEPAAVEKACGNISRERLEKLDARCREGFVLGDRKSEERFVDANRAFHSEIARAARNVRLERVFMQILDEMTRLLHLGFVLRERPPEFITQHTDLIDAIVSNDKQKARELTISHIDSVHRLVVDGILTHSSLNTINIAPMS